MRLNLGILSLVCILGVSGYAQPDGDSTKTDLLLLIITPIPDADKVEYIRTDSSLLHGTLSFQEFLAAHTPVFIRTYGVNGVSGFSMRGGKTDQTKIYWKDIDLNYPSLGSVDLNLVPSSLSSNAEIRHGSAGMSSGSGGLGGSINLDLPYYGVDSIYVMAHTRLSSLQNVDSRVKFRREWKRLKTSISVEHGTGQNNFVFTNPTKPGWAEDTMKNARFNYHTIGGDLSYKLSKKSSLNLSAWTRNHFRELPLIISSPVYYGEALDDQLSIATLGYQYQGKGYDVKARSALVSSQNLYANPQIDLNSRNLAGSWQNVISVRSHDEDFYWFMPWEGQVRYHKEMVESENVERTLDRLSLFGKTALRYRRKYKLTLAARAELFGEDFSGLLPNIGFTYKPTYRDQLILSVNYSQNLRFPTLNDLYWTPGGNLDLQPEKAEIFEGRIASKLYVNEHKLVTSLTAYYGVTDNWIQWLPNANVWSPKNVKSVETRGIEWEGSVEKRYKKWSWMVAGKINYIRAITRESYIQENIVGNDLIYVPRWNALVNATITFKTFGLRYQQPYTGKYFLSSDNLSYMPAYSLWNMSIYKTFASKAGMFNVAVGVENMLDWQYQIVPSRAMPGRYFTLNLNYMLSR